MKFKDIAYVVLIINTFGILHFTGFIMLRLKELEEIGQNIDVIQ